MRRAWLAAAVSTAVLASAGMAGAAYPAGRAGGAAARPGTAAEPAGPVVVLRPGATHAVFTPSAVPLTTAQCESRYQVACYRPAQIQAAYGLPVLYQRGLTGKGQTIVVVDSFGSPTLGRDLTVFDHAFRLPPPPSLEIRQPAGKVPPFDSKNASMLGWAGETELDVEYAHAIAPQANILVVETPTSENEGTTGFPQIVQAERYVIAHHLGSVISQSFSATENSFPSTGSLLRLRGAYTAAVRNHVTVVSASGDSGAADVGRNGSTYYLHPVTSWPASDPLVTAVGGTQLRLDAAGHRTAPASVWNDTTSVPTQRYINGSNGPAPLATGGGRSSVFTRPPFQNGVTTVVGGHRGVPDISMSGACDGAVDMYQSFPGQKPGWYPTCGTSEATPMFAGIVSLAGQAAGHPLGLINPVLYALSARHAPGIVDVTTGSNTVSFRQGGALRTVHGFSARPGYDLASGVGTIYAPDFVPELAAAAGGSAFSNQK